MWVFIALQQVNPSDIHSSQKPIKYRKMEGVALHLANANSYNNLY